MSIKKIRIGTRSSKLALFQTHLCVRALQSHYSDLEYEIIPIKTAGDVITHKPLYDVGGKNLFTQAIHHALVKREIDIGVHSAKDIDMRCLEEITVAAVLERDDPCDVLIIKREPIRCIGTCAPRRIAILEEIYPSAKIILLRGNVDTRIESLIKNDSLDAIVLAAAGLNRLNMWDKLNKVNLTASFLDPKFFVPAAGQGIIAIDCLENHHELLNFLSPMNHTNTMNDFKIETAITSKIASDCHTAIGIWHTDKKVYGFLKGNKGNYRNQYSLGDDIAQDLVAGAGFEPTTFRL